jgi:outer membrane cobalamin receptor
VERTAFTRLRVAWQLPLALGVRTALDVGASGEGEWGDNRSVLKLPPALGGDVAGDYEETRASGGVFGALRQERGRFVYELALRADVASSDSLQLHPHAGVVWRTASGRTRLRASVGRASKLPSFFALASPPALGGNPDLKPERTVGGEAGVEQALLGARLELGAAAFLHEYRDLVDFDFDLFLHVNRARVRTRGVELTARWRPHPSLTVAGEATFVNADDPSGEPLLYEPRWVGGGRVTWKPGERLSLQLEARAVSHYLDRQLPVPDRDTVGGYGLLAFAGSCRLGWGLALRARVDNLTDRSYETLVGFPGPGRSFRAGLGWEPRQ